MFNIFSSVWRKIRAIFKYLGPAADDFIAKNHDEIVEIITPIVTKYFGEGANLNQYWDEVFGLVSARLNPEGKQADSTVSIAVLLAYKAVKFLIEQRRAQ